MNPILDRFEERVRRTNGCWLWAGAHNSRGYGALWFGKRDSVYSHRFAYEHYVGPIPEGYEIDHLCRNPGCCNPAHLEAVTRLENMRRSKAATKTACKYGHDWTDPRNVYLRKTGTRICAECSRVNRRNKGKWSGARRD